MGAKTDKSASSRRSQHDWVVAALRALARGGIGAVRVEAIARELGVTKGSFYWHFADLDSLLVAVFEAWAERGTHRVIAKVEEAGGSAEARLRRLWDLGSGPDIGPELALRDFARRDARAAALVERADELRMDYLRSLLAAHGCPAPEIEARALLFYSLLIGTYFIRARHGRKTRKSVIRDALALILSVPSRSQR